jgi:CheY-like chemotaxis protein
MMGGEIAFTSWPGQGTTFSGYVSLPAASAPSAEAAGEPVVESGVLRVLAVDDHATNRLVFETLLRQMGMTCVAVESAEQAIHAFEAGGWDLILMDIHMPDMDGMAATRALRRIEADKGLARTPIIAVTASVMAHETDAYLDAGMDDVVPKPLEGRVLLSAVQRVLTRDDQACSAA